MVDKVIVMDVEDDLKGQKADGQDRPRKTQKRKRSSLVFESMNAEEREVQIEGLQQEMEGLFGYYEEVMDEKVGFGLGSDLSTIECGSFNSLVAVLMEESDLSLSKLVEEIHDRVKEKMGSVALPVVKSAVLFVGQRLMYGVPNDDADVLEDETHSCLWCWETRDLKFIPKSLRGTLKIRRTCRKKISERIAAVSAMVAALRKSENDQNFRADLLKASEKLGRVPNEAEIRFSVHNKSQRSDAEMAEKEKKREEKLLIKQLEKSKKEAEKEKKKMDRELQKEKMQAEKELKRLQDEAEKDEKRREKEEAEMKKQIRKQQAEAERDQRRREKEGAHLKKQLEIQKQASIMDRFLKRSKIAPCQTNQSSAEPTTYSPSSQKSEQVPEGVTSSMDYMLSSNDETNTDDLRKLHLASWHRLGHSLRSNRKQCWGLRKKPKTDLFKELKLTGTKGPCDEVLSGQKLVDGWGSCSTDTSTSVPDVKILSGRKQLLQFDKSYRPAFYGIWPKKSKVVGPRHPLRKDPELEYDVDSDEEWEEEEPGESLSDCDKDEEEGLEEGCSKADDEDESEDGFFVPDGYLSENEGVQVDRMETDVQIETDISPGCEQDIQRKEFCKLLGQQTYLNNLTEHALRKNQPLIITNLMHEKASLLVTEDLSGTPKLEQKCLQALCIRSFPGHLPIEISTDNMQDEDQEVCVSNGKGSETPVSSDTTILESDLPTVVSTILSCPHGIVKVVESLQQKFPAIPKSQLRNKVREISEFVDNRWQVKKDILVKLGMSSSPAKCGGGKKRSIASFFSKRCLPPTDKNDSSSTETSPQKLQKPGSAATEQQNAMQKAE